MNLWIDPHIYFWRTSTGTEVDLLIEEQGKFIPLEIKTTATPKPQMSDGIISFHKDMGQKAIDGYVIHLGDLELPLAPHVKALPLDSLMELNFFHHPQQALSIFSHSIGSYF